MSSPKRKRDVPVLFWVSAAEMDVIQQKMAQFGTKNLSAYLRKMAVDGYVVQLDLPELKELVSLLRRSSNNLNQLTRKVHETGRIYDADLEDISQRQEQLWDGVKEILTRLSKLSYTEITELDESILFELVDRIEVGETKKVGGQRICDLRVYYRYVGNVDAALAQEERRQPLEEAI